MCERDETQHSVQPGQHLHLQGNVQFSVADGYGSVGSICFWASLIRIRDPLVRDMDLDPDLAPDLDPDLAPDLDPDPSIIKQK
jgi:hypothetical protein